MNRASKVTLRFIFTLIFLVSFLNCKHDKKGSDLEMLSILQLISGIGSPGPKPEWTRLFTQSSPGTISANSITAGQSDVYITGNVSANLDGQPLTGVYDLFVTKYNSSGSKQWTRLLGIAGDGAIPYSITSDNSGNVYVVGETNGALDGQTFSGTPDFLDFNIFVVKYDSNGSKQWTRLLGIAGGGSARATSVTSDNLGNIYVTGTSVSGFDGLTFAGGGTGYFLVKYNSSGTKQWSKLYPENTSPLGIAYDNSLGKIFTIGTTTGSFSNGISGTDSLLIQFDNNGNKIWTKQTGAAGKNTIFKGVICDNNGNVYATGSTDGNIDDQVESGENTLDLLLIKFDGNGNRTWARQLGFTGSIFEVASKKAEGKGISIGKNQDIYVTGYTTGNLDKQTHADSSNSKHNVFIAKYDFSGNKIWTSLLGTKGFNSDANSITVDQQGHPYITGNTNGPLNGESFIGNVGNSTNLFISKY